MVAVPGVFKEHIGVHVSRIGSADHCVDVLIAVVVDIAEGNAVPFLQVAKAAGSGYIFEMRCPAALRNMRLGIRER